MKKHIALLLPIALFINFQSCKKQEKQNYKMIVQNFVGQVSILSSGSNHSINLGDVIMIGKTNLKIF